MAYVKEFSNEKDAAKAAQGPTKRAAGNVAHHDREESEAL